MKKRVNKHYFKVNKFFTFDFKKTQLTIHINNCGGIIDVQPRIGDALNKVYGRQWGLKEVNEILKSEILNAKN